MSAQPLKTPQQLADEHWDWLEPIICYIPLVNRDDALLCYLFKTAMVHGIKHEREKKALDRREDVLE